MNTFKKSMLAVLFSGVLITQTSCLGSFALTVKVYEINNELTDNKFINNLVFWLVGGPVYGFTTTVDVVILNLIEFWTGNNLLANAPVEPTDDRWAFEGKEFKTTRTHDRIVMQELKGEEVVAEYVMSYNMLDNTWYLETGEEMVKMFSYSNDQVKFFFGEKEMEMASAQVESNIRGLQQHEAGVWAMK